MTTEQTHHQKYPVRALLHGLLNIQRNYEDITYIEDTSRDNVASCIIKPLFNAKSHPYIAASLLTKSNNNQRTNMHLTSRNNLLKERHPDLYYKVIHHHQKDYEDWALYCDKEGNPNPKIDELPSIPEDLYIPSLNVLELSVKFNNNNNNQNIAIRACPRQFFNAIAFAENTNALIEYTLPRNITELGVVSLLRPQPRTSTTQHFTIKK